MLAVVLAGAGSCDARPSSAPAPGPAPAPAQAASTAAPATVRFADAAGPAKIDRAPITLTLDGGRTARLSFWRFEPAPGRSEARNGFWCGVRIEAQALTVIGLGSTEALSCDGLAEAGGLAGGRIGLIYRTASPNAGSLTSVVLTRASGAWAVDTAATDRLTDLSPSNLAALRKAVR